VQKKSIEKSMGLANRAAMDCVVKDDKKTDERMQLYSKSNEQKTVNSSIRYQDVEVYLRLQTYLSKITRMGKKLTQQVKWLPYT
jgi:hypothetical protein